MSGAAGFLMLVPARPGARVLEVSEDDGTAAVALRSAGCLVSCVRGSEDRAEAPRAAGFEVRVAADERALAPARGPFDAIVLSISLGRTRGSERIVRDLGALVRGAAGVLAPGGRLALLLPNPIYALPLIGRVVESLSGEDSAASARGPLLPRLWGAARVSRALEEAGLAEVEAYAALPGARRIKFLVSLEGPAGAELFFSTLVPRSRRASRRAAVRLAAAGAAHGLLGGFAPAFGLVASKAAAR